LVELAGSKRRIARGWLVDVFAFSCLLAVVVGAAAILDSLSEPPARSDAVAGTSALPPRGRMLVLLLDSLRYETAVDPALMPNLVALRAESTFARVKSTRDAVTVSSVRAAFTGRDGTRILAFVSNFLSRNAGIESVFTDLAALGRKSVTLSDNAFKQFGLVGRREFANGGDDPTEVHDQGLAGAWAAALYRRGDYDLCVMHVTYTDHIAHKAGVGSPLYVQRFSAADRLVAKLAASVEPEDTFVVMGDHGHDLKGRHTFGLDVPTFALYRGSRFRQGHDLGTMSIRDHRYLMGWALGLALPPAYTGGHYPDALVSPVPLPRDYAESRRADAQTAPEDPHRGREVAYGATVAALCVLFAAWVLSLRPSRGDRRPLRVFVDAALLLVVGAAFVACGAAFYEIRPWLHEPRFVTIAAFWAGLWLVALVVARRRRDAKLGWPLLALPLFVLVPTVYRYGAAPALAPVWVGFILCAALATGGPTYSPLAGNERDSNWRSPLFGVLVLTVAMLYPFSGAEASNCRFDTWVFFPFEVGGSGGVWVWIVLALLAKFVLLLRRGVEAQTQRAGILGVMLLTAVEANRPSALPELALALVLLFVAWRAKAPPRWSLAPDVARPPADVGLITGVLLLFMALTQADTEVYLWLDCLLAALYCSGKLVALAVPASARTLGYTLLLLFAWFGTGWVSFAWTVHRLEWHFLYELFAAPTVERYVWFFIPLILARYLLPLLLGRALLAESLDHPELDVRRLVWTLAGAKVLTVLLFTAGIGWANPQSDVYLEAAQEAGVGTVLTAGLL
jgi:hypothetical protein